MRVALVHYWLVGMAGGERVLEALCRMYPQADIFTHVLDRRALSPDIAGHHIETTFINRLPGSRKQYQRYLPLMPLALEQLDLTGYDLVISSESGPAKGVITRADSLHVCYCHTPMRYLWDTWPDYMASAGAAPRKRYATASPDSFSRNRVWRQWKPPFWSSNAGSGILTPSYCAVTPRASARSASDRNSRGRWNWRGRRKAVRRKFNKRHSRKAPPARFCPESTNPSRPTSC